MLQSNMKPKGQREPISAEQLRKILELAKTIQYGSINLVFHNGVLIQIDHSEKIRF